MKKFDDFTKQYMDIIIKEDVYDEDSSSSTTTTKVESDSFDKIIALSKYLGIKKSEIKEDDYDKGLFNCGGNESYYVLTDEEADEKAKEIIKENVWAFEPDFIAENLSKGDDKLEEVLSQGIKALQNQEYEGCNDDILRWIETIGDLDDFVNEALGSDGRGHFIARYDGKENEFKGYYIYRDN